MLRWTPTLLLQVVQKVAFGVVEPGAPPRRKPPRELCGHVLSGQFARDELAREDGAVRSCLASKGRSRQRAARARGMSNNDCCCMKHTLRTLHPDTRRHRNAKLALRVVVHNPPTLGVGTWSSLSCLPDRPHVLRLSTLPLVTTGRRHKIA